MTMSAMKSGKVAGMFLLALFFSSVAAAGTVLDRGHRLLIDKGLQIQAQIDPLADPYNPGSFDLVRFAESNFTGVNTGGGTNMNYLGVAPGLQWGRMAPVPYTIIDTLFTPEILDAANMVGVQCLGDEQPLTVPANVAEAARQLALWRTNYPTVIGFTNQSGGQETAEVMRTYMATAQPDMLMMDAYPFLGQALTPSPGGSPTGFYTALQKYRLLGLAGNDGTGTTPIPYGAYLQGFTLGSSFEDYGHIMSESEVRLGEFGPWTFGYKYAILWYYNFSTIDNYPNIMFGGFGEASPTPVFTSYAETNRQSRNIGPTLVRLLSTGLHFIAGQHKNGGTTVNNTAPTDVTGWNSSCGPYITAIAATNNNGSINNGLRGDVFVGYFRPLQAGDPNEPYFMILNGLTDPSGSCADTQQTIRLDFDFGTSGVTSLQRINRDTGTVEVVTLISDGGSLYHLDLVLPGGTGDLFKFNTGSAFVTGSAGGLWTDVTYQDNTVKANINAGTDKAGEAYTSNKPETGIWAMSYNLAGSTSVSAFSAKYVKFLSAGPSAEKAGVLGGQDSSLVLKVSLSKYATSALWDPGSVGYNVSAGSSFQLKYSTDGANFISVYTSPTGNGSTHPSAITLTFTGGTKTIYLAYVGTIGTGTQAYWNAASGGLTTITPDSRVFDEWTDITYDNTAIRNNINGGANTGGYANTVDAKPAAGDWTARFNLGGGNGAVNVWSAYGIEFTSSESVSAGWGNFDNTSLVFKLNLPEAVCALDWSMERFYVVTDHDSTVEAKWSLDGVNWTTCYTFPAIDPEDPQYYIIPPRDIAINLPASTSTLYFGWFGTLNHGRNCNWATAGTGTFVFHPVTKSNWNRVIYTPDNGTVKPHVNTGTDTGGSAYTSVKPSLGIWGENYSLAGGTNDLKVWSADYIEFMGGGIRSRNGGNDNSSLVLRINLSTTISSATWQPARIGEWFYTGGSIQIKYSTDGVNFTTLYTLPAPVGGYTFPPVLTMSFPGGTDHVYIGWFCTVPAGSGGAANMSMETTGPLTFTPQPADPTAYWNMVDYDNTSTDPSSTMMNVNGGTNMGGQAYSSTKPLTGDWTFSYPSGAAQSHPLSIWAANFITFRSGDVASIYNGIWGGQDNSLVMKINLSSPVASATWTPTRYYYVKSNDVSQVQLKYSTDGVNWTTCWDTPNNGVQNPSYPYYTWPGTLNLTFASPTTTLYIAYTGTVGTGTTAYWSAYDGSLTFYPAYSLTRCTYADSATQLNVNDGTDQGRYAYYSTKSTAWTENYAFSAPVKVWAGDYLNFNPGQIQSRDWGNDNSTLILRVNLSDSISSATWAPPRIYRYINTGGEVQLKYSTDGVTFTHLFTLPGGTGYFAKESFPTLTMSFPGGTDNLYLGWFGTVPAGSGGHGMFEMESTGDLTFTPATTSPVLTVAPSSRSVGSSASTTTFTVSNTGGGSMVWTAMVIDGGSWLSIDSGGSGTDGGTITARFTENTSTSVARTGRIQITAIGATGSPTEVTVVQAKRVLPGDANSDGKVDVSDLGILAANYGLTSGATWDKGDFNGDGKVDVSDLGILAANYGAGTGGSLDFNADAAAVGLSNGNEAAKEEVPATSLLGCGPVGVVLLAVLGVGLAMIGSLRKDETL